MICIVIPNLNGQENLKVLYESILKQSYSEYKIILVDNGSVDNSIQITKDYFKESEIIDLEKNYGFAAAINKGITKAIDVYNPEFILLLNNDIELTENFIEKGITTFREVKEADFIAVKMKNYFNRNLIDDAGDFIIAKNGTPMARGHGEQDDGQYDKNEFIFGACAGAAFYRTGLFKKCGLFDEDFFAYLEDIDLSFRFQLNGYKCYYNSEIICYHKRRETSNRFSGMETYYTEKNLLAVRMKNYPSGIYLKYIPLYFLARVKRYSKFFLFYPKNTFKHALTGYLKGLGQLIISYKKRKNIQKSVTVSNDYIEQLFL